MFLMLMPTNKHTRARARVRTHMCAQAQAHVGAFVGLQAQAHIEKSIRVWRQAQAHIERSIRVWRQAGGGNGEKEPEAERRQWETERGAKRGCNVLRRN